MGYSPPPLGPYQYHEVLSALRKEIKLNDPEAAIYWANVILTYQEGKTGKRTLAKQLWIMSTEDIDDPAIVQRAFIVYTMTDMVAETDQFFYLIGQMCRARKWWEHEEGRFIDWCWGKAIGDLKDPSRQRRIPSYALDRHTRRGWAIFKQTGQFDDRFTGTDLGRQKTSYMFQRDGEISPESQVFVTPDGEEDRGFLQFWRNFRRLMHMSTGDLEPNDPLGKDDVEPPPGQLFDVGVMPDPDSFDEEKPERWVSKDEKAATENHNWTNT